MSAVVLEINFKFHSGPEQYRELCRSVAETFAAVEGLHWKIWLMKDRKREAGGVYCFESEQRWRASSPARSSSRSRATRISTI